MTDIGHKIELLELKINSVLDRVEKENAISRKEIAERQNANLKWYVGLVIAIGAIVLTLSKLI